MATYNFPESQPPLQFDGLPYPYLLEYPDIISSKCCGMLRNVASRIHADAPYQMCYTTFRHTAKETVTMLAKVLYDTEVFFFLLSNAIAHSCL